MHTAPAEPIADDELDGLFGHLLTTPLALAVSGGADSMALMHLVARWAAQPEVRAAYATRWAGAASDGRASGSNIAPLVQARGLPQPKWLSRDVSFADLQATGGPPHVVVLTVDHGLRAQAAEEAAFVAQEAARLDLPCELLRWEGAKPTSGIQDAARNARRDLMLDVLRAERAVLCGLFREQELAAPPDRCIVMAHTLEDQAETVLMRLMRGSGLEGLGGMHPRGTAIRAPSPERPDHFEADVARPLLGLHKARLVATLEACGARWVVDPSNEDERFERVRVRQVLTQLESVGLSAEKVALSARRLRDADGALDALSTLDWRCARPHLAEVALPMDFRRTPYLLVRVLRALTIAYGGAARLAELSQLEAIAAQFLCDGGLSAFRGATVGGCKIELVRCRKPDPTELCMRIYREGSGEGLPVLHISPGQRVDWDGRRFTVVARHGALPHAVVEALGLERWAQAKRHVAGLGDLGLPAAAVATLPVVGDDRSGDVISYCGLDEALRHLRAAAMGSGGRDVAPAFWQNWEIWSKKAGAGYEATFSGPVRAAIGASH